MMLSGFHVPFIDIQHLEYFWDIRVVWYLHSKLLEIIQVLPALEKKFFLSYSYKINLKNVVVFFKESFLW